MGVRLEPQDEHMHELGPEPTFNESMYFNVYDPAAAGGQGLGGWFRLGNRANEGYAEMTVCLYLPGGRVGFTFARPAITSNDAFDAGGMRFEVVEPFEELRVSYEGKVTLLDDPLQMVDPKAALTQNPRATCTVQLTYRRVSDMFGGEPDTPHEAPGEEFAKGHYEQLVSATGTITVGDDTFEVAGFGLRDHSWGPRTWQAPYYYRWLTANFGQSTGFMCSRVARRDGPGTRGGFVWEDGKLHLCGHAEVGTSWTEEGSYHQQVTGLLRSGEREWRFTGDVLSLVPLRNRRPGPDGELMITRISEGMTRWRLEGRDGGDDLVGYGLSEYLDQLIDGVPVGLAE